MKTLDEQIKDILAAKATKSAKRNELIKLGLTNLDIRVLFKVNSEIVDSTTTEPRRRAACDTLARIISKYTFGVEIECYNAPRESLLNAARANGLAMQSENYNHTDNRHYYKLVSDSSIRGNDPVECVSPILKGGASGFNSLKACCAALKQVGARVNLSTGLHVHVGGGITENQYINTFVNYLYLEHVIDAFMPQSRRDNVYASGIHETMQRGDVSVNDLLNAQTIEDVCRAFHYDRYYKINVCSWGRHQTIEFRQHNGTTNYKKIQMWAAFCLKLVAWSKDNRLTEDVQSIDDIPFLTATEKTYFTNRANALAGANE